MLNLIKRLHIHGITYIFAHKFNKIIENDKGKL